MALLSKKTIQVDFQSPGAPHIVHVVQEDSLSRQIAFQIFSGGAQWVVPDGTLVVVRYYKPDGTYGVYDTLPDGEIAYSFNENIVNVTLAPQMLAVSGDVQMQLNLYDGTGASIATFSIVVEVAQNIVPSDTVESSTYFNLLTQQVSTAVSSAEDAKASADAAAQSAADAADAAAGMGVEYGTFTPVFIDRTTGEEETCSFTSSVGTYAKVGKCVNFTINFLGVSGLNQSPGKKAGVSGLPFPSGSSSEFGCSLSKFYDLFSAVPDSDTVSASVEPGKDYVSFWVTRGGNSAQFSQSKNAGLLVVSGFYVVD